MNDFPRRNRIDLLTAEELDLYNLISKIDRMDGDNTNVVMKLEEARQLLADFIEKTQGKNKFVL